MVIRRIILMPQQTFHRILRQFSRSLYLSATIECKYRIRLWDLEELDGTKYVLGGLHWDKIKLPPFFDHLKCGYIENCEDMQWKMLYSRFNEKHYGYRLVELLWAGFGQKIGTDPFSGEEESDGVGIYARFAYEG